MKVPWLNLLILLTYLFLCDNVYAQYQRIGIRAGERCTVPTSAKSSSLSAYSLDKNFSIPKLSIPYTIVNNDSAIKVQIGRGGRSISLTEAHKKGIVSWTIMYNKDLINLKFKRGPNAGNEEINIYTHDAVWFNTPLNFNLYKKPNLKSDEEQQSTEPDLTYLKAAIEEINQHYSKVEAITGEKYSTQQRIQHYIWDRGMDEEVKNVLLLLINRGFYHGPASFDLDATLKALESYNKSIGIIEGSPFDHEIFQATRYHSANSSSIKYLFLVETSDRLLVCYDKLYEIPENEVKNDEVIIEFIGNLIKTDDKNLVLIDGADDYLFLRDINKIATGLAARFPDKTIYTTPNFGKSFKIYNSDLNRNDFELYYYQRVLGEFRTSHERLQEYAENGLKVSSFNNISDLPIEGRKVIITIGENDSSRKYRDYLDALGDHLKDKILISVASFRDFDNEFYYRLKRIHRIRHVVHFSTPIDPISANLFLLKIAKHLHVAGNNTKMLKQIIDNAITELVNENQGELKYKELRKYLISFHNPVVEKLNEFYG